MKVTLPLNLLAGGQTGTRQRPQCDAADLGFRHKAHQFDGVQLDYGGTEAAGLQQAANLGGVAFQNASKGRFQDQMLHLFLGGGHFGAGAFDAGLCGFQTAEPRSDRCMGRAFCGLCSRQTGFRRIAPFGQFSRRRSG